MQQSAEQYANGSLYRSGPPTDSPYPYPYPYMASYGSAPPYTSSPQYYADTASHEQTSQTPPYVPTQQSLADSMASLSILPQGSNTVATLQQRSYATPPAPAPASVPAPAPAHASVSYTPTVPSYEQSYGQGAAAVRQSSLHPQSTPSQPSSYVSAGFQDDAHVPQAGYHPLPSSLMGSYPSDSSSSYEHGPFYDTSHQRIPALDTGYGSSISGVGSDYSLSSSGTHIYGAGQQGMQGYDYSSNGQFNVYDQGGGMYETPTHGRDYDRSAYSPASAYDASYYEKPAGHGKGPDKNAYDFNDVGLGEVYAYDGGNVEPYGAGGTGTGGSWDSYGSGSFNTFGSSGTSNLPKAVPKVETEDKNAGVQKYRVKMLSDASSSGPQDVLCQIGLDGVRMISPSTNKTVRIYPLETITKWEVNEPSVFTFWAKSAVDLEQSRIRLQSGSCTTNAIRDMLVAACVQFSEMVGKVDSSKASTDVDKNFDQNSEKKKPAFVNWVSLRNRQLAPEEKEHWVPDEAVTKCSACSSEFGPFLRRHHCRNCGDVFCDKCTFGRTALTSEEDAPVVRVCDRCLAEVTQRLSNAKEISSRPVSAPHSHEDLAKKLQEEMERNSSKRSTTTSSGMGGKERSGQTNVLNCSTCGSISLVSGSTTRCPTCGVDASRSGKDSSGRSSWSSSGASSKCMREVACPTCTVHLQVQVPSSGTETVECGVCQHPFLVSAH